MHCLRHLLFGLFFLSLFSAVQAAVPDGPVEGFGTNLPLSQAIDDIVPTGLNIVISNNVDPSTLISWEGGTSWKSSLKSALSRAGLIVGGVIRGSDPLLGTLEQASEHGDSLPEGIDVLVNDWFERAIEKYVVIGNAVSTLCQFLTWGIVAWLYIVSNELTTNAASFAHGVGH